MVLKVGICLWIAMCLAATAHAKDHHPDKPIKAQIRFLADSTMVRSEYGHNEDVYLVSLKPDRPGSDAILARLIDGYPPSSAPLSTEVLTSSQATAFRVRRDRLCDIAYRDMVLRTRPGDMLAILPQKFGFQPDLTREIRPSELLPCYRVVRK